MSQLRLIWADRRGASALLVGVTAALLVAISWSVSSVLNRQALTELPSAWWGVVVSLAAATFAYSVTLLVGGTWRTQLRAADRRSLAIQSLAAVFISIGTLGRWVALAYTTVAVVTTVETLATPLTVLFAPLMLSRELEPVTLRTWSGVAAILAGTMLVVWYGR